MKYYSEKLKKLFDSEAELVKAECAATADATKQEKLRKEREAAAKAIDTMDCPELQYFMANYLSSFSKTLDEVSL